jgi:hypothetical protein
MDMELRFLIIEFEFIIQAGNKICVYVPHISKRYALYDKLLYTKSAT